MHADPGCGTGGREIALDPAVVRAEVLRRITPVGRRERLAFSSSLGRVLAEPAAGLAAGRRIGPLELGCLAGAGVAEVTVFGRPRVAILCTGDELRPVGEVLEP
ncbi:MAG: hypothetical protein KDG55_23880, partial [Rhodocyclaceae bacterium]|nr:hypothetical protein [Rhodocyclaceae bacterium]